MQNTKAIIFDAFATFVEVTNGASVKEIIDNIRAFGVSIDEAAFRAQWKDFYIQATKIGQPFRCEREIFTERIRMFYDRYQIPKSAADDADAMLKKAYARKVFPDAKQVFDALAQRFKVYVASNTDTDVLEQIMKRNRIFAHGVFTSEELKCYKPNPEFYALVLSACGLSPQEVIFIGDSSSDDILGPKEAGMKTIWVDRNHTGLDHGQDHTVSSLSEIPGII
ncbi:MAG: HAD family hydrolase [Clostridia bacterium]|nr:HAD family hydrolase [Clostridia bacterium]